MNDPNDRRSDRSCSAHRSGGRGFVHEHFGSPRSVVWLTPPAVIEALGPFDLDPCAAVGQPWATAARHYTIADDGLNKPWAGLVWCNPPFGSGIDQWLDRLADHGNGLALVPARTEARWFDRGVWDKADAVLFVHGRLRFHHVDGTPARSTLGTPICLAAYGPEGVKRLRRGRVGGALVTAWRPTASAVARCSKRPRSR